MKYLVTGAAGFVGAHLCTALIARGNEVWGLDDLSKGNLENLAPLMDNPRFNFTPGSLSQEQTLWELIQKTEIIYHLAAIVGVKHYVENPARIIEVNTCQTLRLLELAWQLGKKKVIFTSTSEVYGKNKEVPFQEGADRVYGPADRWCYAISKSAAEYLCLYYARRGLPLVIVRYFNVYGPGADSSAYGGVVTRFIHQILHNKPLTVHGDGLQTRCFTYIEDIIGGTIEAGSRPEAEGKIFNLGNQRETTILELARLIVQHSGMKGEITFIPHQQFYGPNYEDIPRRIPNLSAAEQVLDYRARTSLEDGLRKTLAWYKHKIIS